MMNSGPYDYSSHKYENRILIDEQMEIIRQEIYKEIEQLLSNNVVLHKENSKKILNEKKKK